MNKIPTAEEFLKRSKNIDYSTIKGHSPYLSVLPFIEADFIEFAKLHVKAALEAAQEGAENFFDCPSSTEIDYAKMIGSILSAYPEEKIV